VNSVNFLQSYSEVAIAIIGFSGVVVALKGRDASELQKITLSMLILFGSAALVLGILPQILIEAGVSETRVWQGLSFLMLSSQVGASIARNRQAKAMNAEISAFGGGRLYPDHVCVVGLGAE